MVLFITVKYNALSDFFFENYLVGEYFCITFAPVNKNK